MKNFRLIAQGLNIDPLLKRLKEWFNHKVLHCAYNKSNVPRIHIIFDAVSPYFQVGNDDK